MYIFILAVSNINHDHLGSVHKMKSQLAWILGESSEKYVIMELNFGSDIVWLINDVVIKWEHL